MGLPLSRGLLPSPWLPPSSPADGINLKLSSDPVAPPLLLLIDRGDSAVTAELPRLAGLLAPEERARLARLQKAEDRERFLLARAVLRLCLGELLDRPPARLLLATGPRGKPFLSDADGHHQRGSPHFNASHSGRLVLLGFHAVADVGVDVECHRPDLRWRPIARRCLPPQAVSRIETLSAEAQGRAFLEAWCRLEAVLKARGVGLHGLDQGPLEGTSSTIPTEELWSIALPEGYSGAAALARGHPQTRLTVHPAAAAAPR